MDKIRHIKKTAIQLLLMVMFMITVLGNGSKDDIYAKNNKVEVSFVARDKYNLTKSKTFDVGKPITLKVKIKNVKKTDISKVVFKAKTTGKWNTIGAIKNVSSNSVTYKWKAPLYNKGKAYKIKAVVYYKDKNKLKTKTKALKIKAKKDCIRCSVSKISIAKGKEKRISVGTKYCQKIKPKFAIYKTDKKTKDKSIATITAGNNKSVAIKGVKKGSCYLKIEDKNTGLKKWIKVAVKDNNVAGNSKTDDANNGNKENSKTDDTDNGNNENSKENNEADNDKDNGDNNEPAKNEQSEKHTHTPLVKIAAKEPTCTKGGNTETTICSTCKVMLSEYEYIPAKGHTEKSFTVVKTETIEGHWETNSVEGVMCHKCHYYWAGGLTNGCDIEHPKDNPSLTNYICRNCGTDVELTGYGTCLVDVKEYVEEQTETYKYCPDCGGSYIEWKNGVIK